LTIAYDHQVAFDSFNPNIPEAYLDNFTFSPVELNQIVGLDEIISYI